MKKTLTICGLIFLCLLLAAIVLWLEQKDNSSSQTEEEFVAELKEKIRQQQKNYKYIKVYQSEPTMPVVIKVLPFKNIEDYKTAKSQTGLPETVKKEWNFKFYPRPEKEAPYVGSTFIGANFYAWLGKERGYGKFVYFKHYQKEKAFVLITRHDRPGSPLGEMGIFIQHDEKTGSAHYYSIEEKNGNLVTNWYCGYKCELAPSPEEAMRVALYRDTFAGSFDVYLAYDHQKNTLEMTNNVDKKKKLKIDLPKGLKVNCYQDLLVITDSKGYEFGGIDQFKKKSPFFVAHSSVMYETSDNNYWHFILGDKKGDFEDFNLYLRKTMAGILKQEVEKKGKTRYGQVEYISETKKSTIFLNRKTKDFHIGMAWEHTVSDITIKDSHIELTEFVRVRTDEGEGQPDRKADITRKVRLKLNHENRTYAPEMLGQEIRKY